MGASKASESESILAKGKNYYAGSVAELKKVTTPTKQETTQATLVTIVIILFVAFCLFLLDLIFSNVMTAVLT